MHKYFDRGYHHDQFALEFMMPMRGSRWGIAGPDPLKITISIDFNSNKHLDPPPPLLEKVGPLENVGPPLEPWIIS